MENTNKTNGEISNNEVIDFSSLEGKSAEDYANSTEYKKSVENMNEKDLEMEILKDVKAEDDDVKVEKKYSHRVRDIIIIIIIILLLLLLGFFGVRKITKMIRNAEENVEPNVVENTETGGLVGPISTNEVEEENIGEGDLNSATENENSTELKGKNALIKEKVVQEYLQRAKEKAEQEKNLSGTSNNEKNPDNQNYEDKSKDEVKEGEVKEEEAKNDEIIGEDLEFEEETEYDMKNPEPEFTCGDFYHREGNACVLDVKECYVENGVGASYWNGANYGECEVVKCYENYEKVGNACLLSEPEVKEPETETGSTNTGTLTETGTTNTGTTTETGNLVKINGKCGSSNNSSFYSIPTSNLCEVGALNGEVLGYGPWTWSCNGENGGENASCYAYIYSTGGGGSSSSSGGGSTPTYSNCSVDGFNVNHGASVVAYLTGSVAYGNLCQQETRTCNDGNLSGSYTFASCVVGTPANCSAQTLSGYSVPATNHSQTTGTLTRTGTLSGYTGSGAIHGYSNYSQTFTCDNGNFAGNGETENLPTCDTNYVATGSVGNYTCEADYKTFICNAKPANSVWNMGTNNGNYGQIWSGTAWLPVDTATTYNLTADENSCVYKCDTNYIWDGDSCELDYRTMQCTELSSNEVWSFDNSTGTKNITQTTTDLSVWTPSNEKSYNTDTAENQCYYQCASGSILQGDECVQSIVDGTTIAELPGKWRHFGSNTYAWGDAVSACENISGGGWYLPDITWLYYFYGAWNENGRLNIYNNNDNIPSALFNDWYWSSSPEDNTIYMLNMNGGGQDYGAKRNKLYVLCLHD